jgi:acetyl-CoA carboxylase carboxyltransferase component
MTWQAELDELKKRETFAEQLGGTERVKRQHDGGRYTIRERIARLVDAGSFHEIGKIAGKASYDDNNDLQDLTPSNFVCGRARLDGRFLSGRAASEPRIAQLSLSVPPDVKTISFECSAPTKAVTDSRASSTIVRERLPT